MKHCMISNNKKRKKVREVMFVSSIYRQQAKNDLRSEF